MRTLCGIGFLSVALLAGCSSTQSDWQQASASDTVAAYQAFLDKHPNTTQSVVARNRIHVLRDEQAWARAQQVNTLQAFQNYIDEQPSGIHLAEAKDRMASNERLTAWTAVSAANTVEALEGFLQRYPQGPEADQAKARLAEMTGYRVQLASFKSEQQAEQTRERLQGKYGDVLGSVVIVPGASSNIHVVRSAPMGEGEANTACARLKKDHLGCEVVKDVNS
jgi:outer membrane murein-binding lipoprotein Lpp